MNMMTKTTINKDENSLASLVNFERNIDKVDVEKSIKAKLINDNKMLRFDYNGDQILGRVERPLIHQLGSRLWPEENGFDAIEAKWTKLASGAKLHLEEEISNLFNQHDLQLRLFSGKGEAKSLYGVVSPHFVDVNQFDFRNAYIEQSSQITQKQARSLGIEVDRFGNVIETFEFDSRGFQTEYRYGLVYAKNNGYDAYKVNWERYVLVCSNGLRAWRDSKFRWKHTNEIELHDFITNTIAEGKENQSELEKSIKRAQNTKLEPDLYASMMDRLSLAFASKKRIDDRLKIECEDVGRNEWALSQTFTWLGTHDNSLPFSMQPKLCDFGTDILEHSLKSAMHQKPKLLSDGYFGLLKNV